VAPSTKPLGLEGSRTVDPINRWKYSGVHDKPTPFLHRPGRAILGDDHRPLPLALLVARVGSRLPHGLPHVPGRQLHGHRPRRVPAGTVAEKARQVQGVDGPRDVLILPANRELPVDETAGEPEQPRLRVARSNSLGSVFVTVLLLVIFITNVRLSGVWSLVLIM